MANTLDDYLRFHQTALGLRAQRQEILASNIANADTPNYKARDIPFDSALKTAMDAAAAGSSVPAAAQYRVPAQLSADGNSVDMDVERAAFADNAIHYEADISFINSKLKSLLAAIQG